MAAMAVVVVGESDYDSHLYFILTEPYKILLLPH